ncbi:MAG: alpha/beta hydrolase [Candidatus Gracilibacteria bacterium]
MKKVLYRIGIGLISVFAILIIVFLIWANDIYKADPEKLAMVLDNAASSVAVTEKADYWEIMPNGSGSLVSNNPQTGLIYYPGAKVDPKAYFYMLSGLSNGQAENMKVFITKPPLNLALFSINQADKVIADHPEIKKWIVGGHSMGGSMSCEYVKNRTDVISELWLFAAYCASDISTTPLNVLSIHGSLDGILTPEKLSENRKNLPLSAKDVVIKGMNHAQFGNYGVQSGDQKAVKDDETVKMEIARILNSLNYTNE